MSGGEEIQVDIREILKEIQTRLRQKGIQVDVSGGPEACCGVEGVPKIKVVCVSPGLRNSVREMGESPRDQVIMVRVDEATSRAIDAWVETGAVKSRSEAAALFIREGLQVRADELDRLRDALKEVEQAREKLRRQAREVFGESGEDPSKT